MATVTRCVSSFTKMVITSPFSHFLLIAIVLISTQSTSAAPPKCSDLPTPANNTEASCINGIVIDWCNRPVCGKGPGESCGGRYNEFGLCGRGMFCGCDVCQGCNKLAECFIKSKC